MKNVWKWLVLGLMSYTMVACANMDDDGEGTEESVTVGQEAFIRRASIKKKKANGYRETANEENDGSGSQGAEPGAEEEGESADGTTSDGGPITSPPRDDGEEDGEETAEPLEPMGPEKNSAGKRKGTIVYANNPGAKKRIRQNAVRRLRNRYRSSTGRAVIR